MKPRYKPDWESLREHTHSTEMVRQGEIRDLHSLGDLLCSGMGDAHRRTR